MSLQIVLLEFCFEKLITYPSAADVLNQRFNFLDNKQFVFVIFFKIALVNLHGFKASLLLMKIGLVLWVFD